MRIPLLVGHSRKLAQEAGWEWTRSPREALFHPGPIINWGMRLPDGVDAGGGRVVLNYYKSSDKEKELILLEAAGIRVPQVIHECHVRTPNHREGTDFDPEKSGVFVTKHVQVEREYRLHVVGRWAILGGEKVGIVPNPHAWVRSHQMGWGISYTNSGLVRDKCREIGVASVKALGLDFGAVDIGEEADGKLVVFEVNRAPGLFPLARKRYIKAINKLLEGRRPSE